LVVTACDYHQSEDGSVGAVGLVVHRHHHRSSHSRPFRVSSIPTEYVVDVVSSQGFSQVWGTIAPSQWLNQNGFITTPLMTQWVVSDLSVISFGNSTIPTRVLVLKSNQPALGTIPIGIPLLVAGSRT
jgi:hypothetical protein